MYPDSFCEAVANALSRTQSPKGKTSMRLNAVKQRVRSKSPKSYGLRLQLDPKAGDDSSPIGRSGEYRLRMPKGTSIPELESTPAREMVLVPTKESNPKRSQIDALIAHVRAKMLIEHLVSNKAFCIC